MFELTKLHHYQTLDKLNDEDIEDYEYRIIEYNNNISSFVERYKRGEEVALYEDDWKEQEILKITYQIELAGCYRKKRWLFIQIQKLENELKRYETNTESQEDKHKKYIEKINEIENSNGGNEEYHCRWDDLVQEILEENGYEDIAKKYEKAADDFWYA